MLLFQQKGLVIPISLVCRSPQVIPDSTCKILVAQGEKAPSSARAVQDEESESEDSEEGTRTHILINSLPQT